MGRLHEFLFILSQRTSLSWFFHILTVNVHYMIENLLTKKLGGNDSLISRTLPCHKYVIIINKSMALLQINLLHKRRSHMIMVHSKPKEENGSELPRANISCHLRCFAKAFGWVSKYFRRCSWRLWSYASSSSVTKSSNNTPIPFHELPITIVFHRAFCSQKYLGVHIAWKLP